MSFVNGSGELGNDKTCQSDGLISGIFAEDRDGLIAYDNGKFG
jgi:hypothetical protein